MEELNYSEIGPGDDTRAAGEPRLDETIRSLLYNELVCAICQELFVEASTLECGHSFCDKCITDWLRTRLTCPTCRQAVVKPPVRSVCLDRTVEKIALALYASAMEGNGKLATRPSSSTSTTADTTTTDGSLPLTTCFISSMYSAAAGSHCSNSSSNNSNVMPMCAKLRLAGESMCGGGGGGGGGAGGGSGPKKSLMQEIAERKAQCSMRRDQESAARNFINSIFERANQAGVKIVHIGNVWSPREQNRFLRGIMSHEGVARMEYCRLVGLTLDFVAQASREELEIAANNVCLSNVEGNRVDPTKMTVAMLRARFEMFIRYG